MSNLIIGEEGIPYGRCNWVGLNLNFTPQSISDYYRAIYASSAALGLSNVFVFDAFQTLTSTGQNSDTQPWYCVSISGAYVTPMTSVIQAQAVG